MYTVHGGDNIRIPCTMDCVVFPLCSFLFLKAHNQGGNILLLHSDWTTFGGCPDDPDLNKSENDHPKLADTTVMEFGEQNSPVYTMFLAENRKEGGWGRWKFKNVLIQF